MIILWKLIFLNEFLILTNAVQFTKYYTYNNLIVSIQAQGSLKLKGPFQVRKSNPLIYCMGECNQNQDCFVATVDSRGLCTLYNNQTLLINTIYSNNTKLVSKQQMKQCFDGYYADLSNMVCYQKKSNGISCLSSVECQDFAGLSCMNNTCKCQNQIFM